ncbi:MAG: SoxR reducing system RseC family protein [Methylococcaceae bacterium]|nr:SoxR reducing system RseC family protein [Methylococcaceae bacterium]
MRRTAAGCSGCTQTCSSAALGKAFQREAILRLPMQPGYNELNPGDRLLLGIEERELLGLSFLVYLLPLVTLLVGALTASRVASMLAGSADLAAAGGGIAGLAVGFGVLRMHRGNKLDPVILRKLA